MKNKFLIILIISLLSFNSFSQKDTLTLQKKIEINQGIGFHNDSLMDISAFKQSNSDEIFMLKTKLQTQKFLKNIFLLGFIMLLLMLAAILVIYYTKIKDIIKFLEKSEKEIQVRQLQIEKLSLIINNTSDAISIAEANGKIIWANKSFEKLFGVNPEQKTVNIFSSPDPNIKKMLEKCKKELVPVQFTTQLTNEKGEKIWLQRRIIPFINDKKEIVNYTIIDTDYTALKLATEKK